MNQFGSTYNQSTLNAALKRIWRAFGNTSQFNVTQIRKAVQTIAERNGVPAGVVNSALGHQYAVGNRFYVLMARLRAVRHTLAAQDAAQGECSQNIVVQDEHVVVVGDESDIVVPDKMNEHEVVGPDESVGDTSVSNNVPDKRTGHIDEATQRAIRKSLIDFHRKSKFISKRRRQSTTRESDSDSEPARYIPQPPPHTHHSYTKGYGKHSSNADNPPPTPKSAQDVTDQPASQSPTQRLSVDLTKIDMTNAARQTKRRHESDSDAGTSDTSKRRNTASSSGKMGKKRRSYTRDETAVFERVFADSIKSGIPPDQREVKVILSMSKNIDLLKFVQENQPTLKNVVDKIRGLLDKIDREKKKDG